jgi:hypothetical protein
MHEYGWTLDVALSHTLYQLRCLSVSIMRRSASRTALLSNVIRTAYGANQAEYGEFIDKLLNPTNESSDENQDFIR